jgi:hypothetical protein
MCSLLYFLVYFPPISFLVGTKCPMSPSSSCPIEPCLSHCPFALLCATTYLVFAPSPMQTMHLPLVPFPILTNHTPPTNSPYQPLAFCVNVKPQSYTFSNPFDHAHVRPFPLSTLLTLLVAHDQTPQPTFISLTCLQFPLKIFCPTCWHQFTNWGLTRHQRYCQAPNSSNPHDHLDSILSFVPTSPTLA